MKIVLRCLQCGDKSPDTLVSLELEDTGVYSVTCPLGHHSIQTLSIHKFALLFELGLLALGDGYTREAVASFAASAEEFYRFSIKCILARRGLYEGDLYFEAKKLWKVIPRAEPQLGAFVALYFLEFKEVALYPDRESLEFRNAVIHRGRIPKSGEVNNFGQKLLDFMVPAYKRFRKGFEALTAMGIDAIEKLEHHDPNVPRGGSYRPVAVDFLALQEEEPTFTVALEYARKRSFLEA